MTYEVRVSEATVFDAVDWLHEQGFDYQIERGPLALLLSGDETFSFTNKLDGFLFKTGFGEARAA